MQARFTQIDYDREIARVAIDEESQTDNILGVARIIGEPDGKTGEIGSGKSIALRYAAGSLHPAEYFSLYLTATTGSILELYRQILTELGIEKTSATSLALQP